MEQQIMTKGLQFEIVDGFNAVADSEVTAYENKIKEERKQQNYESNSGVSKRFFHVSLDTYKAETDEEKKALEESRKLVERIKIGDCDETFLLYGQFGTGKTHLGCSIIRECGGLYTTSFKLLIEYETCTDFKAKETKIQMLEKYSKEPVLVIDEIGRGIKENTEREILSYIINQRYENELPTVLITNMDKAKLCNFLGKAIFDRFKECCVSVEFTGESKRQGLRKF